MNLRGNDGTHEEEGDEPHPWLVDGLEALSQFLAAPPPALRGMSSSSETSSSPVRDELLFPPSKSSSQSHAPRHSSMSLFESMQREWDTRHREVRRAVQECMSPEERRAHESLKEKLVASEAALQAVRLRLESLRDVDEDEEADEPTNNHARLLMEHFEKRMAVAWEWFQLKLSSGEMNQLRDVEDIWFPRA